MALGRRRLDLAQSLDRLLDDERGAEEYPLPAFVECRQARIGRAQLSPIPAHASGRKSPPGQPLAKAILDFDREIVGGREFLECGDELTAAIAEPGLEKARQPPPLPLDVLAVGSVQSHERRARAAEDVDVGDA